MSGGFAVVSKNDCVESLFYGTDFNSHLGKKFGGMAVFNGRGGRGEMDFHIKSIETFPFRPQMDSFREEAEGKKGIGAISDYEPQPLEIDSHLGRYALIHIGKLTNLDQIVEMAHKKGAHFSSKMRGGGINPTEVVAFLINQGGTYELGIRNVQENVKGSSSVILLTAEGVFLGRDKFGRTPISIAEGVESYAASSESCAFINTGFNLKQELGPGEIGILTETGYEQLKKPEKNLQLCTFLLVYYGNPASRFEGITAEIARNNLGERLAREDLKNASGLVKRLDSVSGIPDSGTGSGLGYSSASNVPYRRSFIKYTETWQRSFMPQNQGVRDLIASMKLIPIEELIRGRRIMGTDDSLVRGTQTKRKFQVFAELGAEESHLRLSCPPLLFSCPYLNFSISESVLELGARQAVEQLGDCTDLEKYLDVDGVPYERMVDRIRANTGVTSLGYQRLGAMLEAIGLPKESACTYCWDGCRPQCGGE